MCKYSMEDRSGAGSEVCRSGLKIFLVDMCGRRSIGWWVGLSGGLSRIDETEEMAMAWTIWCRARSHARADSDNYQQPRGL